MDYATARLNMVDNQIRTNRVQDPRVIAALAETPRELFVPKPLRARAYVDDDLDLGDGRWLVEPRVLALLLQAAAIAPSDVALVIGDDSGYAAAVVARMAGFVVSLTSLPEWAGSAAATLAQLDGGNVEVAVANVDRGYPAKAPYDAIIIAGAVSEFPTALNHQLAEGGRLVGIVEPAPGCGRGVRVVRVGSAWGRRDLFDASVPPVPGSSVKPHFQL